MHDQKKNFHHMSHHSSYLLLTSPHLKKVRLKIVGNIIASTFYAISGASQKRSLPCSLHPNISTQHAMEKSDNTIEEKKVMITMSHELVAFFGTSENGNLTRSGRRRDPKGQQAVTGTTVVWPLFISFIPH